MPGGRGVCIKGGRYRLIVMSSLIRADEALAILQGAGVSAQKSPARGRCRTLCYLVAGQYVNLGRLRELAREALAAQAEPAPVVAEPEAEAVAHLCHKFPVSTPATWAPAVARLRARDAAVTVGAILRETERPGPVLPGEPQPVAALVAEPGPVTLPELPTRFAGGGFAGLQPWGNMPGYPQPGANPTAGTPAMG